MRITVFRSVLHVFKREDSYLFNAWILQVASHARTVYTSAAHVNQCR